MIRARSWAALGTWCAATVLAGCAGTPQGDARREPSRPAVASAATPASATEGRREDAPTVGSICPETPLERRVPGEVRIGPLFRPYVPPPHGCEDGRPPAFAERRTFITGHDLVPTRR